MIPAFVLRNITAVNFYLYAQDFPIAQRGNAVFLEIGRASWRGRV